jgi:hypothetical protein
MPPSLVRIICNFPVLDIFPDYMKERTKPFGPIFLTKSCRLAWRTCRDEILRALFNEKTCRISAFFNGNSAVFYRIYREKSSRSRSIPYYSIIDYTILF